VPLSALFQLYHEGKMYYVSEKKKIINVYRFTLQELSTRIEEYDALKKSTLFQSMHKIIYDIKYYVYLKF
jgi:hypothetical protein